MTITESYRRPSRHLCTSPGAGGSINAVCKRSRTSSSTLHHRLNGRCSSVSLSNNNQSEKESSLLIETSFLNDSLILEAWHLIHTRDVLVDSDEEIGDEHDRLDYSTSLSYFPPSFSILSTPPISFTDTNHHYSSPPPHLKPPPS